MTASRPGARGKRPNASDGSTPAAASADNALLATAGADGTVRLWNLKRQGEVATILTGHQGAVHAVAFAPDGKTLASAGADGAVLLWDVKVGQDEPVTIKEARKVL